MTRETGAPSAIYDGGSRHRAAVAVIGGKLKIVRKARELGLHVTYVQRPDKYDRAHWPYVDQAVLVDYTDTALLVPLLRAVHEAHPLDGVVSLTELGLVPAAEVETALGLDGNPLTTVHMLMDKAAMREHLNRGGVGAVAADVGTTPTDLAAFARAHGLPVVVKPVDWAGSFGVFAVREHGEFAPIVARLRDLGFDRFLMEEYLDGPELSIETLSFDGRHVVVATTDKVMGGPGFVEIGHSMPSALPPESLTEAGLHVVEFLDAVGLRHGPAHTEVKLTRRGPRIVESHNRVGGDRINELAETAYGVDMDSHALGARHGAVEPLREPPWARAGAAVRFFTPQPGRVVDVSGVDEVKDDPFLVDIELSVAPGDVVPPLTWSEDRVGHVIAKGATAADAIAHCERLLASIVIRTEADR